MSVFSQFVRHTYWGNTPGDYLLAAGLFVSGLAAAWVIERLILRRLKKWSEKTEGRLDNFLVSSASGILIPLLFYGAFQLSIQHLKLPAELGKAIAALGKVLMALIGIRLAVQAVRYLFFDFWLARNPDEDLKRRVSGLMPVMVVFIWAAGILFLMDNLGFKVSTLIAGLGIGGAAVALASQSILGDLFSYFSITVDRPFEIGDFIIVGDFMGSVEHIGIKTTRIRSLSGEQLIFSNRDLTDSRIRNYKRMQSRRILFTLGVAYETPQEKLKEIPNLIKRIVEAEKRTRFDRAHFFNFGDSALTFEVVYFVLSDDYNVYMDIQQRINLAVKEAFDSREIKFAYPTRTLRVEQLPTVAINSKGNRQAQPVGAG